MLLSSPRFWEEIVFVPDKVRRSLVRISSVGRIPELRKEMHQVDNAGNK